MSFSAYELSIFGGRPIELYRFTYGSNVYTYCAKGPVTYNSETYAKSSIMRDRISQDNDLAKDALKVTVSVDNAISQLFIASPPEQVVGLSIFKQHAGDAETVCIWKGRVVMPTWNGNQCSLSCESVFSRKRRSGRGPRHTKLCRVDHYGDQCGLNKSTYAVSGTVAAVDSTGMLYTITEASGYASGYFSGGLFEFEYGVYRTITKHDGTGIVLWAPVLSLEVDDTVTLYPGCDRSLGICNGRFSNSANFRGSPHLAGDNPFMGALI